MIRKPPSRTILAALGMVALFSLVLWYALSPVRDLAVRVPGQDGAEDHPDAGGPVDLEGVFTSFEGHPSKLAGAWPRFRGAAFDGIGGEPVALAEAWGDLGPPVLWTVELGDGHAGPVVLHGRVYVLDYDEEERADALRCFSLDDGQEIWRRAYGVQVKRNHGMSRTVPAVTDEYVVTVGPKCHVLCVDAETGAFRWGLDMAAEYGTTVPLWYTAQCPLIEQDIAVLAPAGSSLLVGVDCETGKVVWETPNVNGWEMSHASVMPLSFHGRRMYVYPAIGGIVGVAADGEDRGDILFETTAWNHAVQAPCALQLPDNRFLISAGYGVGSMVLAVHQTEGGFRAEPVLTLEKTVFASEQQTPIFYQGHLFGILPKDGGGLRSQLVCLTLEGEAVWTSGKTNRFGLGPYLIADDKLFVVSDDATLTMLRASTSGYEPLGQVQLVEGRDAWGPLALAGTRLLMRESHLMLCLELGEGS